MSARSVALTLLGKEGVEKAAQVRKDVEKAKKEGSYDEPAKPKAESKPKKPAPKKSKKNEDCLLYTSPSPRDRSLSRMPSSA